MNPIVHNYIPDKVEMVNAIKTGIISKTHIPFTQITTNLDNVAHQEITDGGLDIANPKIFNFTIEGKCINAAAGALNAGTETLKIYYAFSYENDCDIETDNILSQSEGVLTISLSNTGNGNINRNISDLINPKARFIYLWYDVDNLTTALASLDVVLNMV